MGSEIWLRFETLLASLRGWYEQIFDLDNSWETTTSCLGLWDLAGEVLSFNAISVFQFSSGIDYFNVYSLFSKNLTVFSPTAFPIYTVPRNWLLVWEIIWDETDLKKEILARAIEGGSSLGVEDRYAKLGILWLSPAPSLSISFSFFQRHR